MNAKLSITMWLEVAKQVNANYLLLMMQRSRRFIQKDYELHRAIMLC